MVDVQPGDGAELEAVRFADRRPVVGRDDAERGGAGRVLQLRNANVRVYEVAGDVFKIR